MILALMKRFTGVPSLFYYPKTMLSDAIPSLPDVRIQMNFGEIKVHRVLPSGSMVPRIQG
jgi:hypothetical protein